jgi:hypothetical protein
MDPDTIERYEITCVPEGLHIFMWQVLPRVGVGVIALVMLAASFATDPYEGHSRIWAGLGVVALALVALFGVRVENWVISASEVRYKGSLWKRALSIGGLADKPLIVRVDLLPSDAEGTRPPYPFVAHIIGPGGTEIGDGFHFRERLNLDRFLGTLKTVAPIEVEEH